MLTFLRTNARYKYATSHSSGDSVPRHHKAKSESKIYRCVKHGDSNNPSQIKYESESANSKQKQEKLNAGKRSIGHETYFDLGYHHPGHQAYA